MNNDKDLKVKRIEKGTVIDHISGGKALLILRVIRVDEGDDTLLILVNVQSRRFGKKDIIKIENRELSQKEIDAISLIAPEAKINIINNFKVTEKIKVKLPESIEGIAKCANPDCITNTNEPILSKFEVWKKDGEDPILRCNYCERTTRVEEGVLDLFR
ncbi:MAG: aspartate carbamoyltransferase regulatory subunit [Patescibacteria group bacterium]|nr:aspartate carbamoyltransferase regulatory subunit [Patescibacteria group bacterium]